MQRKVSKQPENSFPSYSGTNHIKYISRYQTYKIQAPDSKLDCNWGLADLAVPIFLNYTPSVVPNTLWLHRVHLMGISWISHGYLMGVKWFQHGYHMKSKSFDIEDVWHRCTDLKFKKFPPRNPDKIEPYPQKL